VDVGVDIGMGIGMGMLQLLIKHIVFFSYLILSIKNINTLIVAILWNIFIISK